MTSRDSDEVHPGIECFTPGGVKHFYFWLAPCLAMLLLSRVRG